MIDKSQIRQRLTEAYAEVTEVTSAVLRAVDHFKGNAYAVRDFDLSDDIVSVSVRLREYQETLLAASYFDPSAKSDLRWNHYVYFLTSADSGSQSSADYASAKVTIEADREYARKIVVGVSELADILNRRRVSKLPSGPPADPLAEWNATLDRHGLAFVVDEALQVPDVVRNIARGDRPGVQRLPVVPLLGDAERAVTSDMLAKVVIHNFRRYPKQREFEFGVFNLIAGANGVGKTSLLEAIEYLFCGRNRRSDPPPPKSSVSGFLNNNGQLEIRTSNTTQAATLRARHLVWYGKADLRAVTLHDSFGKFNFLDTDAAARLNVEQSQERIDADLAQLLLGAEAAKTLNRFERLQKGLDQMTRDLEREIAFKDQHRADLDGRLREMRGMPEESDQLFLDLVAALNRVSWRNIAATKDDIADLPAQIQTSLINIGILRAAGSMSGGRRAQENRRMQVAQATALLDDALRWRADLDKSESSIRRRVQTVDARLKALNELAPMLEARLPELAQEIVENRRNVAANAALLAAVEPAARTLEELEQLTGTILSAAVIQYSKEVDERTSAANAARRALEAHERNQELFTNLMEQLRSAGRQIVEQTGDQTHCPMCRTEFSKSQLARILRDNDLSSGDAVGRDLHASAQQLNLALQRSQGALRALRTLNEYPGASQVPVGSALSLIRVGQSNLDSVKTHLDILTNTMKGFETRGWTTQRLEDHCRAAGLSANEVSRDNLKEIVSAVEHERSRDVAEVTAISTERVTLEERLHQIPLEIRGDAPVGSQDIAALRAAIVEKGKAIDLVLRSMDELNALIGQSASTDALELEGVLREAHELTARLRSSLAKEKDRSEQLTRDERLLEESVAEIATLRIQTRRLTLADSVIDDLVNKQSGQALTNRVLSENAAEIATTFARVHAPNEFDVEVGDEGLKIIRRSTKKNVDLHEMSSGQRAAFTLSLFLAMNGRLTSGPRVMIFDDPVSHVDDINTLSFLDYLRDLALSGDRQVFFATADTTLAGLILRKFRFMADQFRHIELARED